MNARTLEPATRTVTRMCTTKVYSLPTAHAGKRNLQKRIFLRPVNLLSKYTTVNGRACIPLVSQTSELSGRLFHTMSTCGNKFVVETTTMTGCSWTI